MRVTDIDNRRRALHHVSLSGTQRMGSWEKQDINKGINMNEARDAGLVRMPFLAQAGICCDW